MDSFTFLIAVCSGLVLGCVLPHLVVNKSRNLKPLNVRVARPGASRGRRSL